MKINFILNGEDHRIEGELHQSLAQALSGDRGFPEFCGRATCLRCLVSFDGKPMLSCALPLFRVQGREVVTREGMSATQDWIRLKAFLDYSQFPFCPSCTEVLMFHLLLSLDPQPPTPPDLKTLIGEVPCRCGSQEAFEAAALEFLKTREALHGRRR